MYSKKRENTFKIIMKAGLPSQMHKFAQLFFFGLSRYFILSYFNTVQIVLLCDPYTFSLCLAFVSNFGLSWSEMPLVRIVRNSFGTFG